MALPELCGSNLEVQPSLDAKGHILWLVALPQFGCALTASLQGLRLENTCQEFFSFQPIPPSQPFHFLIEGGEEFAAVFRVMDQGEKILGLSGKERRRGNMQIGSCRGGTWLCHEAQVFEQVSIPVTPLVW